MNGIYEDISYNRNNVKFKKVKLFFDIKEHSCDTMKHMPRSVFDEYLKMHLKSEITYDDIFKLVEYDYLDTICLSSGLETNILEYLSFYIDVKRLNSPPWVGYQGGRWNRDNINDIVKESVDKILDTRDGKIFILTGIEPQENIK